MSFFGFDPSVPPHAQSRDNVTESYDFQDTYDGLGDELDEGDDAFNNETFGGGEVRKDFNFAGAGTNNPAAVPQPQRPGISYADAVSHSNDDEFMQDLWGTSNAPQGQQHAQQPSEGQLQGAPEKKILSLEEIEAQLTSIDQSQQLPPQPQFVVPGMMPPNQFGGYMLPPGGFMPPPGQYGQFQGAPLGSQQLPPQPIQPSGQQIPPHPQAQPLQPQPQQPQQAVPKQGLQPQQVPPQPIEQRRISKVDLSHFPVLGSKGGETYPAQVQQQPQQQQQQQQPQQQQQFANIQQRQQQPHHQQQQQHHHHHHHHQQFSHSPIQQQAQQQAQQSDLTPEQQAKLAKRHDKVARIMKYSGIMNPKDKDFVTRFQLSQIVTEDPYNEDFYAQVFKVVHPKVNSNPMQQNTQQHNSIAQAYLEQSGHRLGGRYKRADVALQRMQQQVQKAVTVAKERPKLTQYAREGALGKISFGNGKKPRQQLEIFSKAAQREIEKKEAEGKKEESESTIADSDVTSADKVTPASKKARSPSISAPSKPIKKYSKKDIMSILENIISKLMNVESESRLTSDVDTTDLWESLHILDQPSSSGDDELEVNPFIQCLNHNKTLKILPRLFKFLSREQILTIVTLIMSNLENLSVIKLGSYTTYPDKKVSDPILKLVEAYSLTFSKVLMNAAQDFKFNEIIGLLVILIEHNNVSFVSTTKIGLSILTTLLSRAELIRGEGVISATDLSEWSSCYDELFTSLESRIAAIFPPHPEDVDDGSSRENYVWQFLATLSLGGKLSHQRIIVDEVRDEIFGVMNRAKAIDNSDLANLYKKQNLLNNLNMYLVVMGLVADENEIKELQN